MDLKEVMTELESYGSDGCRKIWRNHGAVGEIYGVKVGDMKKILKKTKKDHELACQLLDTGNLDAMYLGALMANAKKVTPEALTAWAESAHYYMVLEYPLAGLAAESPHGWDLGLQWIEHKEDHVVTAGWACLGHWVSIRKDEDLDHSALEQLIERVAKEIHGAENRVRYTMNGFLIAVGSYVPSLTEKAVALAETIGTVSVDMGNTSCKVPKAIEVIDKLKSMDRIGHKRKKARC